jgi:hypothetical protein
VVNVLMSGVTGVLRSVSVCGRIRLGVSAEGRQEGVHLRDIRPYLRLILR